jgi:MFS family permease
VFISPNINASSPKRIYIGNLISAVAIITGLISASVPGIVLASLVAGLSSGASIPLIIAMGCEWNSEKTAYGTIMPFSACFFSYVVFPPLSGLVGDFLGIPWGVALGGISAGLAALFSAILGASLKSETPLPEPVEKF